MSKLVELVVEKKKKKRVYGDIIGDRFALFDDPKTLNRGYERGSY